MGREVLIVDDAKFMRLTLGKMLKELGYTIKGEANDGWEAIEKYRFLSPDLVTIDIVMPNMDGVQAIHKILEIDPKANIVVCSAMGQRDIVLDAIRAGARDFVLKPVDAKKLKIAVEKLLG